MEKKQDAIEKLLTGALNIKDKSDSNALYLDISEKIASKDKEENAKAVAAVLKVEELTGKEPEFESLGKSGIKRCLGQDIRDGLVTPSEESEKMYGLNKQEPLPGKGDLSDQEISLRDIEIGLKSAGYESGVKPSSKDQMALEMMGGKTEEEKLNPAPFGEQEADMSFGPSKVLKGLLTQDFDEVVKGLKETAMIGAGAQLKDQLDMLSPIFKPMQTLSNMAREGIIDSFVGDTKGGDIKEIMGLRSKDEKPLDLEALRDGIKSINDKGSALVGELAEAFKSGKVGKELNALLDVSKNGSLEDVEKHVENLFGRVDKKIKDTLSEDDQEKKPEKKPEETPQWSAELAGRIAGATTYKAGRSKGLNPKKSGEMASITEGEATDVAKSTKDNEKSKDNAVDMAKDAKNMMAKTAASIADKIPTPPGLGKAIAVGIIIADKATDMMMDLINNKGGTEVLNKAGGSLEEAEKAKATPDQKALDGGIDVFKQEMKKTKGGMVKRLIPTTDDVATTAMKGAVDGIMSWGKDQVNGSKTKPAADIHRQLDQPT
jgi:hypothetical protein